MIVIILWLILVAIVPYIAFGIKILNYNPSHGTMIVDVMPLGLSLERLKLYFTTLSSPFSENIMDYLSIHCRTEKKVLQLRPGSLIF